MKFLASSLLAVACLVLTALPLQAEPFCANLGWAGGANGTNIKYVKAQVDPDNNSITYEWKNGVMSFQDISEDEISGTWSQDGSTGQFYLKWVDGLQEAVGWWNSTQNKEKRKLFLKACD